MATEATHAPLSQDQGPEGPETPETPQTPPGGSPGTQGEAPAPDALTAEEGAALLGKPEQLGGTPAPVKDEALTDEARAAAHFASDATTHKLTVHREDGPFRHVEFTGLAGLSRITLITWPYNLIAAGSHGSYHFERYGDDTEDMFNWLRGTRVNASSWASKLVNGRDSVTEYSRDLLVAAVNERVAEAVSNGWAPAGLEAAVQKEILGSHLLDQEATALEAVYEFEHGKRYKSACSCGVSEEHDSYSSAVCWNALTHVGKGKGHKVDVREIEGFSFGDEFADWNIRTLNYHYLWTCHAMVWVVGQYDAARKAEPEFFQPGRIYAYDADGFTAPELLTVFRVVADTTQPDAGKRVAFGWIRGEGDAAWAPHAEPGDEWPVSWTDITGTAAEVSA